MGFFDVNMITHRVSPQAARYTPMGGREKCGRCRFYIAPKWCGHVTGPVSPMGWCKYFSQEMRQQFGGSQATGAGMAGPTFDIDFMNSTLGAGAVFTRASTGWAYGSTGVLTSYASNVPRFDYDPATLALKGLLLEDTSTNLIPNSGNLAAWGLFGSSGNPVATPNLVIAPDGTTTGSRLVYPAVSGAGNTSTAYQSLTVSAVSYAFSVWLRGNVGGEQLYLTVQDTGYHGSPRLTLTTAWQRFSFISPVLVAGAGYFTIGTDLNAAGETSTPAQTVYAWGAQVEAIGYSTSYIPTTSAAVTRAADVLSYPIASVTGFDQTKGSLAHEYIVEGSVPGFGSPAQFVGANAANDFISLDELTVSGATPTAPTLNSVSIDVGGATQAYALYTAAQIPAGPTHRGASAWASGVGISGAHDGVGTLPGSGPPAALPVITNLTIAGSMHGQPIVSQWARRTRYWPRQLSAAELISVTS